MATPTTAQRRRARAKAYRAVCAAVDGRDGQCCTVCGIYCGKSIDHHHVVFRSRGGADTVENIVSLCRRCHANAHLRRGDIETAEGMVL